MRRLFDVGSNCALRSRNGPRSVKCIDLELKQLRTPRGVIWEHKAICISVVFQSKCVANFVSKSHPGLKVASISAVLHERTFPPRYTEIA
jgi:hypothetical protein